MTAKTAKTAKTVAAKTTADKAKGRWSKEIAAAREVGREKAKAELAKRSPAKAKKLTAEEADKITVYKKANPNPASRTLMVQSADGRTATFDEDRLTKQLTALAKVGASFAAVTDYLKTHGKAAPALAKGVESRTNPHSAKALQDQRASAKGSAAKAAPKASAKGGSAKSSLDGTLVIKLTAKGADKLKVGGSAGSIKNLTLLSKSANVAKALANGLKGADITYAVKTGTITLG